jgi:hypothetical protein
MENFIPPYVLQRFLCGQVVPKESNTLNTRGHKVAKNSTQVSHLPSSAGAWQATLRKG